MVREKFIQHTSNADAENPEHLELVRMKSGAETLLNDDIDNLRRQFLAID